MSEPDLSPEAVKDAVMTLDDGRGGTWVAAEDYVELSAECASLSARLQAAEAERDALLTLLASLATEARCRCMYESRDTERAYETGQCDHQRARAVFASRQEGET